MTINRRSTSNYDDLEIKVWGKEGFEAFEDTGGGRKYFEKSQLRGRGLGWYKAACDESCCKEKWLVMLLFSIDWLLRGNLLEENLGWERCALRSMCSWGLKALGDRALNEDNCRTWSKGGTFM